MGPLALLSLLASLPTVSLSADSGCAPREVLSRELAAGGVALGTDGVLTLRLEQDGRLTLHREGKLVLSRSLGSGTCDELGRAAAVVVGRWVHELQHLVSQTEPAKVAERTPTTPSDPKPLARATRSEPRGPGPASLSEQKPLERATRPELKVPEPASASEQRLLEPPTRPELRVPEPASASEQKVLEPPTRPEPKVPERPSSSEQKPPERAALPEPKAVEPSSSARPNVAQPEPKPIDRPPGPPDVAATIGTTPPTTPGVSSPPATVSETVVVLEPARVTHLEVLAGGGLTAPGAPSIAPMLSLDLALVLNHRLRINLAGLFDFGGSVTVFDEAGLVRGKLATRGGLIIPGAGYCVIKGPSDDDVGMGGEPLRLCLGAVTGLRIVEGESSGSFVFQATTSRVATFVLGANAQLAFVRGPFHLAFDLSLLVTPQPPRFSVQALPTTLPLPTVQALFRLSVGLGSSR